MLVDWLIVFCLIMMGLNLSKLATFLIACFALMLIFHQEYRNREKLK